MVEAHQTKAVELDMEDMALVEVAAVGMMVQDLKTSNSKVYNPYSEGDGPGVGGGGITYGGGQGGG